MQAWERENCDCQRNQFELPYCLKIYSLSLSLFSSVNFLLHGVEFGSCKAEERRDVSGPSKFFNKAAVELDVGAPALSVLPLPFMRRLKSEICYATSKQHSSVDPFFLPPSACMRLTAQHARYGQRTE